MLLPIYLFLSPFFCFPIHLLDPQPSSWWPWHLYSTFTSPIWLIAIPQRTSQIKPSWPVLPSASSRIVPIYFWYKIFRSVNLSAHIHFSFSKSLWESDGNSKLHFSKSNSVQNWVIIIYVYRRKILTKPLKVLEMIEWQTPDRVFLTFAIIITIAWCTFDKWGR